MIFVLCFFASVLYGSEVLEPLLSEEYQYEVPLSRNSGDLFDVPDIREGKRILRTYYQQACIKEKPFHIGRYVEKNSFAQEAFYLPTLGLKWAYRTYTVKDESPKGVNLRGKAFAALNLRSAFTEYDGMLFSSFVTHQAFLAQSFGVNPEKLLRSLQQIPCWGLVNTSHIAGLHLRLIREQAMKHLSNLMRFGGIEPDMPFHIFLEDVVGEEYSQHCEEKSDQGCPETLYSPLCLRLLGESKSYALFLDSSKPTAKIESVIAYISDIYYPFETNNAELVMTFFALSAPALCEMNDPNNFDAISILVACYAPGKLCEIKASIRFSWRKQGVTLRNIYTHFDAHKRI